MHVRSLGRPQTRIHLACFLILGRAGHGAGEDCGVPGGGSSHLSGSASAPTLAEWTCASRQPHLKTGSWFPVTWSIIPSDKISLGLKKDGACEAHPHPTPHPHNLAPGKCPQNCHSLSLWPLRGASSERPENTKGERGSHPTFAEQEPNARCFTHNQPACKLARPT